MQRFDVQGMTCEHCANAITAAIATVDPLARVTVDVAAGKVQVSGESAPEDVLLEAFAAEGYEATPTRLHPTPTETADLPMPR